MARFSRLHLSKNAINIFLIVFTLSVAIRTKETAFCTALFVPPKNKPARRISDPPQPQVGADVIGADVDEANTLKQGGSNSNKRRPSGPSPRPRAISFSSPLLEAGYPPTVRDAESGVLHVKPLLLYLPGFDGTLVAPFLQLPELSTMFDVRGLAMEMSDRSTFDELRQDVIAYLERESLIVNDDAVEEGEGDYTDISEKKESNRPPHNDNDNNNEKANPGQNRIMDALNWAAAAAFPGTTNSAVNAPSKDDEGKAEAALSKNKAPRRRPIYLIGESFGGVLASSVTLAINSNNQAQALNTNKETNNNNSNSNAPPMTIQGLTLINPATCYPRSKLAAEGPGCLASNNVPVPLVLYPLALLVKLVPLLGDDYMFPQLLLMLSSKALPSVIDTPEREAYMGRTAFSLPFKLKFMPQDTLKWRLEEWLQEGCEQLDTSRLKSLGASTSAAAPPSGILIVCGERDKTLPSLAEAERLMSLWQSSQSSSSSNSNGSQGGEVFVVEGAGHASTCGSRVDLAAIMRDRFPELRRTNKSKPNTINGDRDNNEHCDDRIQMKEEARNGVGEYFGMTARYDGKDIGLMPTKYWSKELYRPWKGKAEAGKQ
jgi:pimeloyl-ACP methyl ester carboxylesterase